jgi:hypothetical protein
MNVTGSPTRTPLLLSPNLPGHLPSGRYCLVPSLVPSRGSVSLGNSNAGVIRAAKTLKNQDSATLADRGQYACIRLPKPKVRGSSPLGTARDKFHP